MRRAVFVAALALLSACAGPPRQGAPASSRSRHPEPPEVRDPNFILVVQESVPNADDEGISYTKVFVDGKEAGVTAVGKRSEERRLKLKLPLGNQPVRLEQWNLPAAGEWTRLPDPQQPRERFVRVEDGSVAVLTLRFADAESSNTLTLSREAALR